MKDPKILIVEDESIVALDMETRLVRLGYQVVGIADSGSEAQRLAAANRPDLALMDIRLKGGMDGIQTAERLRARFDTPVVYLTAYADEATLQRAKVTMPHGYLVKPFDERELHSTVEMALYKVEMEKQLTAQAARLQKVIASVPDGVAVLDEERRIVLTNERASEYLRFLCDADVGVVLDRLGAYSLDQLVTFKEDGMWYEIRAAHAPQRVFEATLAPMQPGEDETGSQVVLVLRDVTAEHEMRQRVQTQERLAALGQFAAGVAHDFNNILATILMQPYMIEKTEPHLSEKSRERLANLTEQAKHASNLIKQVLDFSRANDAVMKPVDLMPLFKEFVKLLMRTLPENIRVELLHDQGGYVVEGDVTRLNQMMMNLALNARDAMPDGGTLRVALDRLAQDALPRHFKSDADEYVRVLVIDTGTGIPHEIIPRVFEPFFTTKGPDKGTGLGLAQVYGIVQKHNGFIDVESQLGQGTNFAIYLPAVAVPTSDDEMYDSGEFAENEGVQPVILLVEDDTDLRNSLYEVLEISGYEVLTAVNGRDALEVLARPGVHVDLVLSDIVMPEMSGVELVRELKRRKFTGKVLTMTGYVSDEAVAELNALGVMECLPKPLPAERLLRAIEGAL